MRLITQTGKAAGRALAAVVCVLPVCTSLAFATEFYVSVHGRPDGDGSITHPWDLESALKHPSAVQPGDTVYLRGGVYAAPDRLVLRSRLAGVPEGYITVRPYRREHVRIDGGLEIHGAWTVFRNLEIANSRTQRITEHGGPFPGDILQPAAITVFANNVKIVNNTIHDTSTGVASWKDASDNEFYGNIIYNNGWMGPDRAHGHGVYMQNRDGSKLLIDNVVFNQFELGIQIYGTSSTFLNNFYLEGNILFNNGLLGGRYSRNILIGGTVRANRPQLVSNYTWYPVDTDHGGDNNIGYYPFGEGCSELSMESNYFVSGGIALTLFNCSIASFRNNTFIGGTRAFSTSEFSGNTYLRANDAVRKNRIFVRPNRWEPGRAHIVVYNWERRNSVAVDLQGTGLKIGELFEIRDIQNLGGRALFAGAWNGDPVTIPMTTTAVAAPVGQVPFQPVHTGIEFGVFFVRKIPARERSEADPVHQKTFEAEQAQLSGELAIVQEESASGGHAVSVEGDGKADFTIDIDAEDKYALWLRVRSRSSAAVTYAISVDGDREETGRLEFQSAPSDWQWLRVQAAHPEYPLDPYIVHFAPGPHRIVIRTLDRDLLVDSVLVTNSFEGTPETDASNGAFVIPLRERAADSGSERSAQEHCLLRGSTEHGRDSFIAPLRFGFEERG